MAIHDVRLAQTALAIKLDTEIDLTAMLTGKLKYIKTDGTEHEWDAAEDTPGVLQYNIQNASDLDQLGLWTVWTHVTFNDLSVAPGDPIYLNIIEEGH